MKGMNASLVRRNDQASVSRRVVQVLNSRIEHKRAVSTTGVIDWTAGGTVSLISTDIAQGDNIGNRSGDVIRPLKFTFRISSFINVAGQILGRVILLQDSMCNGSTPAVLDILNTASVMSPLNPVTRQARRFKILADFMLTNVLTAETQVVEVTRAITMKGSIHYVSTAAAAASAGRNSLYALFIADAAGAANQKTYIWSYDLEYVDA